MKTEVNSLAISMLHPTLPAPASAYTAKTDIEKNPDGPLNSLTLNRTSSNRPILSASVSLDEGWNSPQPLILTSSHTADLTKLKALASKLRNDVEAKSFTSMVIAFMVMSLQIFSKLQKAEMQMALVKLNLMITDMRSQIVKMVLEKDENKTKDLLMASFEMTSAAVQLVGSGVTTVKLGGKISELNQVSKTSEPAKLKASVDANLDSMETKIKAMEAKTDSQNLTPALKANIQNEINGIKAEKGQAVDNLNKLSNVAPSYTPEQVTAESRRIQSDIDLINTRQQGTSKNPGESGMMWAPQT